MTGGSGSSGRAGDWWSFLLAVVFFAGLPIGLIGFGESFIASQEKSRLGNLHLERIERNLFRLKREGADLFYLQRELNSIYGLIGEHEASRAAMGNAPAMLDRAHLAFISVCFFDASGEIIRNTGRDLDFRSAWKRIYAALVEPERTGRSELIVKGRSLFQSMLGNIDAADLVYRKGDVTPVQLRGKPGYFYWNAFYAMPGEDRENGKRRNQTGTTDEYLGGMIAWFEEAEIPRDFALKQLIRQFNRDAVRDEGYALIDIERPAGSHGLKTVSGRVGISPKGLYQRAVRLREVFQRHDQDDGALMSIVSIDAGRVVAGVKRFHSGLAPAIRVALRLLAGMILVFVTWWAWRIHLAGGALELSIRHKLVALFLYATAIPITALVLLGSQYLLDRNQVMVQERMRQLSGLIENIDDSFQAAVRSLEQLYQKIARLRIVQRGEMERVNEMYERLKEADLLAQMFMVDSRGRMTLMKSLPGHGRDLLEKLIPTLARKIFQVRIGQNEEDLRSKMSDVMVETLTDSVADFMSGKGSQKMFGEIIESNDRIKEFILGKTGNLMYTSLIWGAGRDKPANLLLIVHRSRLFARRYLMRLVRRNSLQPETVNPVRLAIVSRDDANGTYPKGFTKYPFIREMADKVSSTETQHANIEQIGGQPYLVVASPLKKMPDYIMYAMYPRRLIDDVIRSFSLRIGLIALASGGFAFFIGLLLARHFLWPIRELAAGVAAIGRRDFRHQVPELGHDEFGDLGTTFNRVIANLEEMHVGKVVQETLFPSMPIRQGGYVVYGSSDAMTDLGGDYFDSFVVNDRYILLVIGDVTGHGVPAALLMAMAKSGVAMLEPGESLDAVKAVSRLNGMLFDAVKKKRLMSLFYGVLDTETHELRTSNAGHCFPYLFQAKDGTVRQIENGALPLGARKKSSFEEVSTRFSAGDCLVLYTDGIVEAGDAAGQALGYERFGAIIGDVCREGGDAEAIHARILERAQAFTASRPAEDDITLIVVRRNG
ncbi:MAG TPA: SpoIIE family protein phosphatase [Candidatus Ozemobacteraceae bacterium]